MIDRNHPLLVTRQAQLMCSSRGFAFYESEPISACRPEADVPHRRVATGAAARRARMLRDLLQTGGFAVVPKHMTTQMRQMGIEALYCKRNTSRRTPEPTNNPWLLRTLAIRWNQVWAMDVITSRWPAALSIWPP